ncbi:unnamed protein product [Microthlaspi erraticum]|uniref:Protein kinase domain-containing protein n=1 Tax=Microthlaspi erraticum TaxID=1685480 RepID=A0A6D2K291_9BRAS|nr:unnamed protein product [Microthlaspi erraticum]
MVNENFDAEKEDLRVFSYKELKKATKNFRRDMVIVRFDCSVRTFSKCYIDETTFSLSRTVTRIPVSVLESHSLLYTPQDFEEQVKSLGQISHPNLVKILGYCCKDDKSHFLVLDYLHKGSLDSHLYGKEDALPWEIRVKIAIGIAIGLVFLHSIKNIPLHQEFRMHNIILDEQYNAKLLYLKSNEQCLENPQFKSEVMYVSPEYCLNETKTDVFTFGVILLELLTGSKDTVRNERGKNRCFETAFLPHDPKIGEIIDPRLGSDYHVNAGTEMVTLIRRCTKWELNARPSMEQVLDTLNYIAEIKDECV